MAPPEITVTEELSPMASPPPSQPLGPRWDGQGTHFAIASREATAAWLCLFDAASGTTESARLPLEAKEGNTWSLYLPGVGPGQLYGFRLQGPWDPSQGRLFDTGKLLLDPYAREVVGELRWHPSLFAPPVPGLPSGADSAPWVPKGRIVDSAFDWRDDTPPATPWEETLIYEAHVKGLTAQHPDVPPELRGTFSGLAHPAVLEHLRNLWVTAVELMPILASVSERRLVNMGLSNYWGYNPLSFFAPNPHFCATAQPVREIKALVRALHAAGLEVLLDVVFNHTAEGDERGPVLSLKGIDNTTYYRLRPEEPGRYENFTGCGNTLAITNPPVLRLVMDCLRYWASEIRIDGFRFDLAPVLGRQRDGFDAGGRFFEELRRDPILSRTKLIAEPWDLGPGGYRLGHFPSPWREWNDRYRNTVRSFWRGDAGQAPELATRLLGNSDLFSRSPLASINLVSCHDGFTLRDLVSYEHRHNLANGEEGRDGHGGNLSRNWGREGDTSDLRILDLRLRARRNLLATLAFSQGVPLLGHGDELGRTQRGNNNAYCHDSELTWVDWRLDEQEKGWLEFCRRVFALRRRYRLLRHPFFFPREPRGDGPRASWLRPDGAARALADWRDLEQRSLVLLLEDRGNGEAGDSAEGRLLLLLNAHSAPEALTLPPSLPGCRWTTLLDTAHYPEVPASGAGAPLVAYSLRLAVEEPLP